MIEPRARFAVTGAPRRFLVLVNPDAGGARKRFTARVAARLIAEGRDVVIEEATAPGRIRDASMTTDFDALLVVGGDGSVNEAVRGLLARPAPRPLLGIVPQGTVNVLAHELGLPGDPDALAALFLRGATKPLHVGLANDRPFVLMASAGLDAAVVKAVDLGLKRRLGRAAYAVATARYFLRGDFADVHVDTDSVALTAKCAIVTRSRFYGGRFVIDAGADVTKPGLTLVALTEVSPRGVLALARYFARGEADGSGILVKRRVTRATLRGDRVETQMDGDYLGPAPIEIREAGDALRVIA